jgi:hypothetical protein
LNCWQHASAARISTTNCNKVKRQYMWVHTTDYKILHNLRAIWVSLQN